MPLIGGKDADAFEVFYDRHGGIAYSLAYRIVGDRGGRRRHPGGLRLDLAQRRPLRRSRGSVRSWTLGIVRNRAIDALRSKAGRAPKLDFDDDSILEQRPAAELDRRRGAAARDRARRCAGALGELPGRAVEGDRAGLLRRLQPLGDRRRC